MDINRIITIVRNLKEDVPTNNTGSSGSKAGFSAAATGAVTGYDKLLHEPLLDQDYQTPYGLNYRLSNVFPAAKLTETDVDDMVDASKEYEQLVDEQRFGRRDNMKDKLQKIIDTVRGLREEAISAGVPTNNASSGAIAGLPPDTPPVKQRKKYIYGGRGSRRMWMPNKKNG